MRDLVCCILLICLVGYVYAPSLDHVPRADHLVFLLFTNHHSGFIDTALDAYSYSREIDADPFLFRPLGFLLLAAIEFAVGRTSIFGPQLVAIIAHLSVVLILYLVFAQLGKRLPAFTTALFFGTILITQEAVTWTHETPLVIATGLLIIAFRQLFIFWQSLERKPLLQCVGLLLVATLIHEITIPVTGAMLLTTILTAPKLLTRYPWDMGLLHALVNRTRTVMYLVFPPCIYIILNLLDRLRFESQFTTNPFSALLSGANLHMLQTFYTVFTGWLFGGLFPTMQTLIPGARAHLTSTKTYAEAATRSPEMMIWGTLLTGLLVIVFIQAWTKRHNENIQSNNRFAAVAFIAAIGMVLLIVLGRAKLIVETDYLSSLTYYIYPFYAMIVMAIFFTLLRIFGNNTRYSRQLTTIYCLLMLGLAGANGHYLHRVNVNQKDQMAPQKQIVTDMRNFLATHPGKYHIARRHYADYFVPFVYPPGNFSAEASFSDILFFKRLGNDKSDHILSFDQDGHMQIIQPGNPITVTNAFMHNIFHCQSGKVLAIYINERKSDPCSQRNHLSMPHLMTNTAQLARAWAEQNMMSQFFPNSKFVKLSQLEKNGDDTLFKVPFFDGYNYRYWSYNKELPVTLNMYLPKPTLISAYSLGGGKQSPQAWSIFGLLENEQWQLLDRKVGMDHWLNGENKLYQLSPTQLTAIRLVINEKSSSSEYVRLNDISVMNPGTTMRTTK